METSIVYQTDYSIIESENISFFTDNIGYDRNVHLDADFSGCQVQTNYTYNYEGEDYKKVKHVSMEYTSDLDFEFPMEKSYVFEYYGTSSTDGSGATAYGVNENYEWDGTIEDSDINSRCDNKELMEGYRATRKIAVYIDGKLSDVFTVEVKANGN